ncbi:hypothetical protein [Mesorhizobium sp. SP-1A]|uniref:hypothetical protein n=1 Tax=Mesorhizobium sp. SP-1A TaxID=3077840 RepID=UPI0028F71919|nr:hypothetical protein [Mesorhizobium sp. SP-1A]
MEREGSPLVFFGVVAALIFLVIGGLTTKIKNDTESRSSQIVRLYDRLASLEKKSFDNCERPFDEVKCVTAGNVVIYQQPEKISVYDSVSKANLATFIKKGDQVHYSATGGTLSMLLLEFLEPRAKND